MAPWKQVLRPRRGQNMVEIAFSLWIFIFMGLGLMEGAMLAWNVGSLQHAVEDGARYALRTNKERFPRWPPGTWAVNTPMDELEVEQAVVFSAYGLGLLADITENSILVKVNPTGDTGCATGTAYVTRATGDLLRVCATYHYTPLFLNVITGGGFDVTRQAQIMVE
jgi:hypothetical protein